MENIVHSISNEAWFIFTLFLIIGLTVIMNTIGTIDKDK